METRPHPAKFTDVILSVIDEMLPEKGLVLDPFAGTGKLHSLSTAIRPVVGVEIEPEWASLSPMTIVGNAVKLPFGDKVFDAIATSPTYGNRMADHHEARDGSYRVTYRHMLGRRLNPCNSGQMQWGDSYREFHGRAWRESVRVLRPGGYLVLNIADHIRKGERQLVTQWHVRALWELGMDVVTSKAVNTPGMRNGANSNIRVGHEYVIMFRRNTNSAFVRKRSD